MIRASARRAEPEILPVNEYQEYQDAREATASDILAGPDGDGICLELSVYDSDFYDTRADDGEGLTD